MIPVKNEDTKLFHVINGVPVEMTGHYEIGEEGKMYLDVNLPSYSVYYLTEKVPEKESSSNLLLICVAAIIAIVAVTAIAYMLKRKHGAKNL